MPVGPGTKLGPYELEAMLGAGGMGAVYRARDTRLGRSVAVKVLPAGLHANEQERERLKREARAISSLSHRNICALYDVGSADGIDFLVMELLDGQSLAERLRGGKVPIDQAVALAIDIANALEAAHRAGVIHRDLKPGNIMLTRSGARLVDFGLAKLTAAGTIDENAQTTPAPLTREGAMVGTVRYMAPEQLEGRALDSRTDIYAFGLVLYEMLSGKPAGTQPPPLRSVVPDIPADLERIVARCLEKEPDHRWQSAADLAVTLHWTREAAPAPPARRSLLWIPFTALAALLLAVLAAWFVVPRRAVPSGKPVRFAINPPPGKTFAQNPIQLELAVSPDGRTLAIATLEGQLRKLYLRPLDALESRPVEGTDGASGLFWSPDSRWIGFFAGGFMKKVALSGGPPETICSARGGSASWGTQGKILFTEWGPGTPESVRIVDVAGGTIGDVTDARKMWGVWPSFLPDGRNFLFFAISPDTQGLFIGSTDRPGQARPLLSARSRAEVRGDSIFYVRDSVLVRQRFDLRRLAVEGDPIPIADSAFSFAPLGTAQFSVSADGSVVVWQRTPLATQLVWRDWSGRELGRLGNPEFYRHFSLSPDGQRLAVDIFDKVTGVSNVSLVDLERGVRTAITSNPMGASAPFWLRSGEQLIVAYGNAKRPTDAPNLTLITTDGRPIRPVSQGDGPQYATSITSDDREVLYTVHRGRYREIEVIPISGKATPSPLTAGGAHDESDAVLSPNDRWVAFQSDESGRPEIYIRAFRANGERLRVSSEGGSEPQWSKDGRSLLYIRPDRMLMKAEIATAERPRVVKESAMFLIDSAGMMEFMSLGLRHYLVASPDRILVREIPGHTDADPISVLVNVPALP